MSVRADDGTYYAYGTEDDWGDGSGSLLVPVVRSTDLVSWEYVGEAIDTRPRWAAGFIWAPDFSRLGDRYVMYLMNGGGTVACRATRRSPHPPSGRYTPTTDATEQASCSDACCADGPRDPMTWTEWAEARPVPEAVHLDTAAAGRSSTAVLDAVAAHARREATEGAYVAAMRAGETISALRRDLAKLTGVDADGIALVESAERALDVALAVAPFEPGDEVLVAPSEWGPNLREFAVAGLEARLVEVDDRGAIDPDLLDRELGRRQPALVHLVAQASHRAVRQPVADLVEVSHRHGVPVWVDAAQAIGHCDVADGADLVYATSRKWLTGPRGVGMLAVAPEYRDQLRLDRVAEPRPGCGPLDGLESHEAHIAGRIGLAVAVGELLADGPDLVSSRLDEVGRQTREAITGVAGWATVDAIDAPGAITGLQPTDGQDVFEVRERLLAEHGIVTTPCATARAPHDMPAPLLRVSPHVDVNAGDLAGLAGALAAS